MNKSVTPFSAIYSQWLDFFRALLPGGAPAGPAEAVTDKQAQVAAHQGWEDEGGSIKPPVAKPGLEPGPKIPF